MKSVNAESKQNHLLLRSANPALSSKTFSDIPNSTERVMTVDGTVNKIAISLLILLSTGYLTYSFQITGFVFIGFIGGLIVGILTIMKKALSPNN